MRPAGRSLLIDVGSTTSDIIPIEDGVPVPLGRTDLERLSTGELVYLGVRRTPLCALAHRLQIRSRSFGIAREFFASTADLHLILGHVSEDASRTDTADGRPATRDAALSRVSRMLCADLTELSQADVVEVCEQLYVQEVQLICQGISQVLESQQGKPQGLLTCGEGEFLAQQAALAAGIDKSECEIVSLNASLGAAHSQGACAFALARLAAERL
jgi:probable H4MPT-linked C1 transfer pathway protein